MEEGDLVSSCERFARWGNSLTDTEARLASKICCAASKFLEHDCRGFVMEHSRTPMLCADGIDLTPLQTNTVTKGMFCGRRLMRKTKDSGEFVSCRVFFQTPDGETHVLVTEPFRFADKTAWTHFQFRRQVFPLLRQIGHQGIEILYRCSDRAIYKAYVRHEMQHQQFYLATMKRRGHAVAALELKTWEVSLGCILHDAQNALAWGCREYVDDRQMLRDQWICIESVRNGLTVLFDHLGQWLAIVLMCCDWLLDPDSKRVVFSILTDDELLQEELLDLELRFEEGRLRVAKRHEDDPNLPQRVTECLRKAWKIEQFADTRWNTMGISSQLQMLLLWTGMVELVQYCIQCGKDWHLRGYLRFGARLQQMSCVFMMSSTLSRSLCKFFLDDDRILLYLDKVDEEIEAKLSWIAGLALDVWRCLGFLVGLSARDLRHKCISSVVVQVGFLMWRLRPLRMSPWTLTQGDLDGNLDTLLANDPPVELVAWKIWSMLTEDYNREDIKDGLKLLKNVPASGKGFEEGHKCGSAFAKFKKRLCEEQMRSRSTCGLIVPLLHKRALEVKLGKLKSSLKRLKDRKPRQSINAQHVFVKQRQAAARVNRGGAKGTLKQSKNVLKDASKTFRTLSVRVKRHLKVQAIGMQDERVEELAAKKQVVRDEIARVEAQLNKDKSTLPPLCLSSCRWSVGQRHKLLSIINDEQLTGEEVKRLRTQALVQVRQFRHAEAMERVQVEVDANVDDVFSGSDLWWLSQVCRNRDFFADSTFRFETPDGDVILKFVFARRNPDIVAFHRLAHTELLRRHRLPWSCDSGFYACDFTCDWKTWIYSDEGVIQNEWPVMILVDSDYICGRRLVSDHRWRSLREVVLWFPAAAEEAAQEDGAAPSCRSTEGGEVDIFELCPWLLSQDYWNAIQPQDDVHFSGVAGKNTDTSQGETVVPYDWETRVADELAAARAELAGDLDVHGPDFYIELRGGRWTDAHRGVAYDCVRAKAATATVEDWCRLFSLPVSGSFAIGRYGRCHASRLAACWKHRMQFFYDMWRECGEDNFCFTPANLALYVEPPEVDTLLAEGSAFVQGRLALIQNMAPMVPV